jgi:enoyl-CoA hydratase/carnithine racemase
MLSASAASWRLTFSKYRISQILHRKKCVAMACASLELDADASGDLRLTRTDLPREKKVARRTLIYNIKGHIANITLDRPRDGNKVDREMAQELNEVASTINGDNDIYVVTLTGAGKSFCDGGDAGPEHPAGAIASINRPVIAAVNGGAVGAGLEITLAADIRVASDTANFSLPQAAGGRLPSDGGTQRLPRIVGRGKALEMLLTAATISAAEALETGLVSRVVPREALAGEVAGLAETIAAKGPIALRYLKEAINAGMDMTLEQGLRLEADLYFLLHTTADRTEGIRSYLEKRKPEYRGK